jgi:lipopolysaccharide export system protein LptC
VTGSARPGRAGREVASKRDPRARAYAQARRHSIRVRFYKLAIPLGTAVALAFLAFILAGPRERIEGLTLGPITLSGTKVTMESPRLTGYHKDAQPYEVTATSATQDVRKPHIVELKEMQARMTVDEHGQTAHLEAAAGVFDTQKEQLNLQQDVRVTTTSGHEARLKSAAIDFKAGTVMSREPVTVKLTNGVIEADALEITDRGKIIAFSGRVRAVLDAGATSAASATAPGLAPAQQVVTAPGVNDAVQALQGSIPQPTLMSSRP